jgi:hypothetical protein
MITAIKINAVSTIIPNDAQIKLPLDFITIRKTFQENLSPKFFTSSLTFLIVHFLLPTF